MVLKRSCFLLLAVELVVSCSEVKNVRYQDTSMLEKPPELEILEKPKVKLADKEIKKTGLGDAVEIAGSSEQPVIKIKKLFDRSWGIVGQALKLNKIEVTDKNRDEGVFYVVFDPDAQESESKLFGNVTFSFFQDEFEEAAYKITVVWQDTATEVSAELTEQASKDIDDEDEIEASIDSGAKLIQKLFKTIRDDLPLD